jgi:hypothetical protein
MTGYQNVLASNVPKFLYIDSVKVPLDAIFKYMGFYLEGFILTLQTHFCSSKWFLLSYSFTLM